MLLGAIEAGGTKFVLGVGTPAGEIIAKTTLKTENPAVLLPKIESFFADYELAAVGVGSFGPLDLNPNSKSYGFITNTPKLAWQNFDLLGSLKSSLDVPIFLTTDVNASCLGEKTFGAFQDYTSLVYFTIGTGVGAGGIQGGQFIQGLSHPEMGHMLLRQHPADLYAGNCPFHQNCLEGLASGPAIMARAGRASHLLAEADQTWEFVSDYLAQAAFNVSLILSPEVIIFGGGVMKQPQLLPKIRQKLMLLNQNYLSLPNLDDYLQTDSLADLQGLLGCIALAQQQLSPTKMANR
ncbi:ROK family protein [Enterococcus sp. HY326]|uniref:ROK family protein n=1 Tax=Enterococcus sp. HY326 TaxID=2971265 RepID=UPI00223ED652|nr:ROK family protein [Enterococcus sp. HY326]